MNNEYRADLTQFINHHDKDKYFNNKYNHYKNYKIISTYDEALYSLK